MCWIVWCLWFLARRLGDYADGIRLATDVYDLLPGLPLNILYVGGAIWFARVWMRLALAGWHARTRAAEKRVMINTYLALVRRGDLKSEERGHMLQSIFQPSADGIIDDGAPVVINPTGMLGGGKG